MSQAAKNSSNEVNRRLQVENEELKKTILMLESELKRLKLDMRANARGDGGMALAQERRRAETAEANARNTNQRAETAEATTQMYRDLLHAVTAKLNASMVMLA